MRADRVAVPAAARRFPEPVLFGLVAASTTLADVLVFWLLLNSGMHPIAANVASYTAVAALNYCLNASITFAHRGPDAAGLGTSRRMLAFAGVKAMTLAISTLSLAAALVWLAPLAAKAISIAVTFGASYLLSSRLVFVPVSTGKRLS